VDAPGDDVLVDVSAAGAVLDFSGDVPAFSVPFSDSIAFFRDADG
jgi:hypothetical protein